MSSLHEWTEPPAMSATLPAPAVLSSDGTLWLAYRIARDPHHCAVVRFHHVEQYGWGASPAVHGPEQADRPPQGGFYQVGPADDASVRRWLITFPTPCSRSARPTRRWCSGPPRRWDRPMRLRRC